MCPRGRWIICLLLVSSSSLPLSSPVERPRTQQQQHTERQCPRVLPSEYQSPFFFFSCFFWRARSLVVSENYSTDDFEKADGGTDSLCPAPSDRRNEEDMVWKLWDGADQPHSMGDPVRFSACVLYTDPVEPLGLLSWLAVGDVIPHTQAAVDVANETRSRTHSPSLQHTPLVHRTPRRGARDLPPLHPTAVAGLAFYLCTHSATQHHASRV